ncbi:PRC-barrel domain-containing protein [Amorphus sp. MBR-141]
MAQSFVGNLTASPVLSSTKSIELSNKQEDNMRKSLLTAVSAAALISAGMVSPTFAQSNSDTSQPTQSETQATPAPSDGTSGSGGTMPSDSTEPSAGTSMDSAAPADAPAEKMDSTAPADSANAPAVTGDGDEMEVAQPEGTYMASELTGEPVQNGDGEDLANIDDFVIDEGGQISHVVVSFGGFLGLGDKQVMLPWDQIQLSTDPDDPDDHVAMLSMTKEEIEALPEFKTQEDVRDESDAAAPAATGTGTGMGTTGTGTGTATQ